MWFAVCLMTLILSACACGVVLKLATRYRLLDHGNARTIHKTPTPRLGGVAFIGAALLAGIAYLVWHPPVRAQDAGLLAALGIVVGLGLADDLWTLEPFQKLGLQIVAVFVFLLTNPLPKPPIAWMQSQHPLWFVLLFGVGFLWIVGVMNAVNLIDGLDALAASISATAALGLAGVAAIQGQTADAMFALFLVFGIAGFLPFNLPLPRTRLFMGDSGALSLGFLLAAISQRVAFRSPGSWTVFVMPAILLSLPIFDTAAAIVRRRGNWANADCEHTHHRLLKRLENPLKVVGMLALTNALLTGLAFVVAWRQLTILTPALLLASYGIWWSCYTGRTLGSAARSLHRFMLSPFRKGTSVRPSKVGYLGK